MGDPGIVPQTMTPQEAANLRLPASSLARIPELKVAVGLNYDQLRKRNNL